MTDWMSRPSSGYTSIEQEFEASLRRAFVEGGADYIVLYDRRQRFQHESAVYGRERGWLTPGHIVEHDEQSSEVRYRLTAAGCKHFNLTTCENCNGTGKVHSHNDECWECEGTGITGEADRRREERKRKAVGEEPR